MGDIMSFARRLPQALGRQEGEGGVNGAPALALIPWFIGLSRRWRRTIWQNLGGLLPTTWQRCP